MKSISQTNTDKGRPRWREAKEGRAELAASIDAFVSRASSEGAAPEALAMRVTAGAGKTRSTLESIARQANELLARGHVLIYVPTLDLAERACNDFRTIAPAVPCAVVRGREAPRPNMPDQTMCKRTDLVRKISGLVPSITAALCRRTTIDGKEIEADCAAACPYLAQHDAFGAKVYFLAHSYLNMTPPIDLETPVVLRVIDEKFWPVQVRTTSIFVEDFMRAPSIDFDASLLGELVKVKGVIVDALQRACPLNDHLRTQEIDAELLSRLARAEKESRQPLEVYPNAQDETIFLKLAAIDRGAFLSSIARQSLFARLIRGRDSHCNRITQRRLFLDCGSRQVIEHHQLKSVPIDAPLLMLDADADARIIEAMVPGAAFESIDIEPEAEVIQISDRTLSNAWLLDPHRGTSRRSDVLRVIEREVAQADKNDVLVIGTKSIIEKLQQDCGKVNARLPLPDTIFGATPRWFGPKMQGVNDFEDYTTVVVVGRLQPPLPAVEAQARAIFGDYPFPFGDVPDGGLPEALTDVLMRDGQLVQAESRMHPDSRVQTMLEQTRERGTLQAIARLRLVAPNTPKRVVILSSTPLPNFPITTFAPFFAVVEGLENEPDPVGYSRLNAALKSSEVGQQVRGVRLSAAGLHADLAATFSTIGAAKEFRRHRKTNAIARLILKIACAKEIPLTFVHLKKEVEVEISFQRSSLVKKKKQQRLLCRYGRNCRKWCDNTLSANLARYHAMR